MSELAPQRIVCAANRNQDGVIVLGARHFDSIMRDTIRRLGLKTMGGWTQGFIDQYGNFLTREQALEIAKQQGQLFRRVGGDETELYSENLY